MATLSELQVQLDALTVKVNAIIANSSTIADLDAQSPINQSSELVVTLGGVEYNVTVSQLMKFINGDAAADAVFTTGNVGVGRTDPTTALSMGGDKFISFDVNAGITASTTQSQGNGALTAQINEISVCANDDDTVTLPTAITGIEVLVVNHGANILQIFPFSGDDLGGGADEPTTLEVGSSIRFIAYTNTYWHETAIIIVFHAQMYEEDNAVDYIVNEEDDWHVYHSGSFATNHLVGFTFDAGGAGTSFPIATVANVDGSHVTIETTGDHLFTIGDIISQTALADPNYTGIFEVETTPSSSSYTITATWGATDTGVTEAAATLTVNPNANGHYIIIWGASATGQVHNETFDFQLYKNTTVITGSKSRRQFGLSGVYGSFGGVGIDYFDDGDKISFGLSNTDSASDLVIRNLTIATHKL